MSADGRATSPEAPRLGSARREKSLDVAVEAGDLVFTGRLFDTYRRDDELTVIHELIARGRMKLPELEIAEIEVEAATVPFGTCRRTLARLDRVIGLRIAPGFSRDVHRRLGGGAGCSHVTTLVLELAAAGVLHMFATMREYLPYSVENRDSGLWSAVGLTVNPQIAGACSAWSIGGEALSGGERVLASRIGATDEERLNLLAEQAKRNAAPGEQAPALHP